MISNYEECASSSCFNQHTAEDTNGWTNKSTKRTNSAKNSHTKSFVNHTKETSDGKLYKEYSGKHSKGKSNSQTPEFREERAKKEHSQDVVRQNKRMSYTLKQSNVKVGQSFVDGIMRDFSNNVCNDISTIAKIVEHCKSKALDACRNKLRNNETPTDHIEMFHELALRDIPIREYSIVLDERVSEGTITQECANALTVLFTNNKATEECAKVLDELMRYHRADVIGHPDIMELIKNTRAQDGYTYYHWLVFPSRTSSNAFNKEEFIRCIDILHECGCSPFAKNLKNETCIDSLFYSVLTKKTIPAEFKTEIYLKMLTPPAFIRKNMLVNCLNKVTLDKVDQFSSLMCWSVHVGINDLVQDFICRCLKVNSSTKINGHYKSIGLLYETITCVLKMGPQGNQNNLKEYFDTYLWDGLDISSQFLHGVINYIETISTEPLDIEINREETLETFITEINSDGTIALKLNPLTTCRDALGAIIGEVGNIQHANEYVERALASGNVMSAVTCIAHSGTFTQSMAVSITKRTNSLISRDKVFFELTINNILKKNIPFNAYHMLQFNDQGSLILESISIASSQNQSSVSEKSTDSFNDELYDNNRFGSIYVPPFDASECDKFRLFGSFGNIKVQDIVKNSNGEITPECVDNAVYSLEKKLVGCIKVDTVVTLFAKIIESTKGSELEVAKFVVDCCKIPKTIISNALKLIVDIPPEEISSCFDNSDASKNIKKLAELYKLTVPQIVKSPVTSMGQFSLLEENNGIDDIDDIDDNEHIPDVVIRYEENTSHIKVVSKSKKSSKKRNK
jgi:hypothetical protein